MSSAKKFVLLGATGSIGESTLQVLRKHPEKLELIGVSAHKQSEKLHSIIEEFKVPNAHLICQGDQRVPFPKKTNLGQSTDQLDELAAHPEAELVVVAIVGSAGLRPTLAALKAGKDVVLANKESLVVGGKLVTDTARESGARIIPADSEHNAIHQCLLGQEERELDSIILTASGGAFRDLPLEKLKDVTLKQALKHPNWSMGPKVTIDSATMANKGLELIEAYWLFGLPSNKMEVVIHPSSIVHAMVRFIDGCCLAQLSPPSMTFALQNALLFPERHAGVEKSLDFSQSFDLSFSPPCHDRYPCLRLARECLSQGGPYPLAFNAANEVAVDAFRMNRIGFVQISNIIEESLNKLNTNEPTCLADLLELDTVIRSTASQSIALLGH
ncbi:MAG TPA: 1-deoxy-D-xylulose-5-phosphate reductoisomerase [Opitutae bacterium]|nr:1-deoxy-D-xylulose-5-phosphate reductoisomerase [Opitutae bacterium]